MRVFELLNETKKLEGLKHSISIGGILFKICTR